MSIQRRLQIFANTILDSGGFVKNSIIHAIRKDIHDPKDRIKISHQAFRTHKILVHNFKNKSYSPAEIEELNKYIEDSKPINTALLHNKLTANQKQSVAILDKILNKHTLDTTIILHRGINNLLANQYIPGKTYKILTYLSLTTTPIVAMHFGNNHLQLEVPKGTKGIYLGNFLSTESEFLLPRNLRIHILSNDKIGDYNYIKAKII